MAVRISSVLLNAGREDDRITGLQPKSGIGNVYGGMVITQDETDPSGKTFKFFDGSADVGATNVFPWGLAIEPTAPSSHVAASGSTAAGVGFDTYNYARGGYYSAFHRPGNLLDVYDDQSNTTQVTVNAGQQNTSAPFVVNRTWAVGDNVFATAAGLLDNTNAAGSGGARIGYVRGLFGSGSDLILSIELDLSIVA